MVKKETRPTGLEPAAYGLEIRQPENTTTLSSIGYSPPENHLTANSTENNKTIQQDLRRLINYWESLP